MLVSVLRPTRERVSPAICLIQKKCFVFEFPGDRPSKEVHKPSEIFYKGLQNVPDEDKTVGPWPETKEERIKAAKKYNLIPEDYEPYPFHDGFGDYPKLEAIGQFNRDPYDDYENPWTMRHYGEPFHLHADIYEWEKFDPLYMEKPRLPLWLKFAVFFGPMIVYHFMAKFCNKHRVNINYPVKHRLDNSFYRRPIEPGRVYYEFPTSGSAHH